MINLQYLEQRFAVLTDNERDEMFQMLTDHAGIISKIFPDSTLMSYVVSGVPKDDHMVTRAYTLWKNTKRQ